MCHDAFSKHLMLALASPMSLEQTVVCMNKIAQSFLEMLVHNGILSVTQHVGKVGTVKEQCESMECCWHESDEAVSNDQNVSSKL